MDTARIAYFKQMIKHFIDEKIANIVLEFPHSPASAQYSPAFISYWQKKTGSRWSNPADSVDVWYRAAKLKQEIFTHSLQQLTEFGKTYSAARGRTVHFFIATKGSIANAQNNIVAPGEDALKLFNADGIIAQSGFLSSGNFMYQGKNRNRPFAETYFSDSWFANSTDQNSTPVFLPVEIENPFSLIAAMMQPSVEHFSWQNISNPVAAGSAPGKSGANPKNNADVFSFVLESLQDFPAKDTKWLENPWPKTGVVFSDTYMYQRGSPWTCEMESFYQLAMPFLQHGVPVQIVPLERLQDDDYLDRFDVLFMSYEGYKPAGPEVHPHLRHWVSRKGGLLFFYLGISNQFDEVNEWWADLYDRPHEHLFEMLKTGLYPFAGLHKVGRGIVYTEHSSPREMAKKPNSGEIIRNIYVGILRSYAGKDAAVALQKNHLVLQRGPYYAIYVSDEGEHPVAKKMTGNFIDLFAANLPLITEKEIRPGQTGLLLNTDFFPRDTSAVVLSSGVISNIETDSLGIRFDSFLNIAAPATTFLHLPGRPQTISCKDGNRGEILYRQIWFDAQKLLQLTYSCAGQPVRIEIK